LRPCPHVRSPDARARTKARSAALSLHDPGTKKPPGARIRGRGVWFPPRKSPARIRANKAIFRAPPPRYEPGLLEGGRRVGGSGGEGQRGKPNRRAVFVPDHGDADGRAARAARYHAPQGAAKPPPRTRAGGTAAARSPWRPFGVADAAGCRRIEVRALDERTRSATRAERGRTETPGSSPVSRRDHPAGSDRSEVDSRIREAANDPPRACPALDRRSLAPGRPLRRRSLARYLRARRRKGAGSACGEAPGDTRRLRALSARVDCTPPQSLLCGSTPLWGGAGRRGGAEATVEGAKTELFRPTLWGAPGPLSPA
jgi:hypothetical protein